MIPVAEVHERGNGTGVQETDVTQDKIANTKTFTDVKDKSQDPKGHVDSHTDETSFVCVFPRRKEHNESISSSSASDICQSPHAVCSVVDNHSTATRKIKKKPRRAAIGFPSEIERDAFDFASANPELQTDAIKGSTNNPTRKGTQIIFLPTKKKQIPNRVFNI